ncbi:hypothetical protein MKW98_026084 [Papaver atlanticum]|uniref:RRM domain-containing protein n=1 Tax=Papaver atlanticum TaxID=357466 RepID=A0AAD4X4Q8_9MAGN|nr:hypothetical protein MKW98_026084 [Papaver atlanticum]
MIYALEPEEELEETEEEEEKETEEKTEEEEEEEDITKLLEPFSKKQLIDIICSISTENREIIQEIRKSADQNPSHCELFVHGLDWETTSDQFKQIFSTYGDIMQCRIVGFILYKHRKSVSKALKEPLKKIGNRIAMCHLSSNQQKRRKIFVGNYGEIEEGPCGFDFYTGKLKGYAMFIYKTVQGARRAVEEPIKRFDGYILHCQMATDQRQKFGLGLGGFSPYTGLSAGFNTQNGFTQPYVQGTFSGVAQPYVQGIFNGAAQPYGQGTQHAPALFAAGGQNPYAIMNPAFTGFSPASMSPTTSQQGIPGAFGMGNPVCQDPQSHEPNSPSGVGPAERRLLSEETRFVYHICCLYVFSFSHCSLKIMYSVFTFWF